MKIVILSECFLTSVHLERLKKLAKVQTYLDTSTEKKAVERLRDADMAVIDCFITPTSKRVFDSAKRLRYVSLNSIGYDLFDLEAAKAKSIKVSNIPGYSVEAVAEHTIALIFTVIRKILLMDHEMRKRPYVIDPVDISQRYLLGFDLKNKTLGIIGLGNIGQRVAELALCIGMKVIAYNRSPKSINGIKAVTLHELLKRSDVVSLHVPLNNESGGMIGEKELKLMKPHAVLINTARGKIVDEIALIKALKNKVIGGAGLDTLASLDASNPLLKMDNVVLTPHGAWYTRESFQNLAEMVVSNVESYVKGKPVNLIA